MKILWLSHLVPYPPKGGVLQRSYNLIREVSKYHEITLLAFTQTKLLKAMFSTFEAGLREAKEELDKFCNYVEFIEIPCESTGYGQYMLALKSIFSNDPYSINWLKSENMQAAIGRVIKESQFDLVHFDTISLAPYISRIPGIPKVLDHHNIESHMMLRRAEQETGILRRKYFLLEGKKLARYEEQICREFDMHITCSSLDSDRLLRVDPSLAVQVIPNGVDVEYYFPMYENEEENNLIFAGGLGWYPNADAMQYFAREIWPQLKKHHPDIVMNVVGKDPSQELIKLAEQDKNFRVHGFVDDVRDYISKSSVYVCPIRNGGGTKLKILDACAMGMAIVSHPVACEGLEVSDGENILLASTPDEFIEKIIKLVRDLDLRRYIGINARNTSVKVYNFTKIGHRLSDLYMQLKDKYV